MIPLGLQFILIIACLAAAAFFSGVETGAISTNRLRLQRLARKNNPAAQTLTEFLRHPDRLLGTTLVGVNLATVIASVTAAGVARSLAEHWGPPLCSILMTLVVLVFCEYLPKAWFRSDPLSRTLSWVPVLRASARLLYPLSLIATGLARILVPVPTRGEPSLRPFMSREELKYLSSQSEQTGALSAEGRRMIHGILELASRTAAEIMTPRKNFSYLQTDASAAEAERRARLANFVRLPVFDPRRNAFTGILHILDIPPDPESLKRPVTDFMRPAQLIPSTMRLNDVLVRMRAARQPMMLVDDNGDTVGLLTMEDILGEIVRSA